MRNRIVAALSLVVFGLGLAAILAAQPTPSDAPTRPHSVQAHAIEITAPPVTETVRPAPVTQTVVPAPVTVTETETRTVWADAGTAIEEDSTNAVLAAAMDAGGDFRKGPDVDAWANDSDPTGATHSGCAVVVNDTSYGQCPDGYTFAS
jgi:hypothetical protein